MDWDWAIEDPAVRRKEIPGAHRAPTHMSKFRPEALWELTVRTPRDLEGERREYIAPLAANQSKRCCVVPHILLRPLLLEFLEDRWIPLAEVRNQADILDVDRDLLDGR